MSTTLRLSSTSIRSLSAVALLGLAACGGGGGGDGGSTNPENSGTQTTQTPNDAGTGAGISTGGSGNGGSAELPSGAVGKVTVIDDRDGDGAADFIRSAYYDTMGSIIRKEYDYQGDGVVDSAEARFYLTDAQGIRVEQIDSDGDGVIDSETRTRISWTDGGRTQINERLDPSGEVEHIERYYYKYDPSQSSLLLRSELGVPGEPPYSISTYEYDADDNLIRSQRVDENGEGSRTELRYDNRGNNVESSSYEVPSGEFLSGSISTYNANNRVIRIEPVLAPGSSGSGTTYVFTYDANNRITSWNLREDNPHLGLIEETRTYTYTASSHLQSMNLTSQRDGQPSTSLSSTFEYVGTIPELVPTWEGLFAFYVF